MLSQLSYSPIILVGLRGLEPRTSSLSEMRSNQLSYKPNKGYAWSLRSEFDHNPNLWSGFLLRKEVIQPHLPVRLPCYDLALVTGLTFDGSLSEELGHRLRVLPTSMAWRAVCTRPGNVFTAPCWCAITSDSCFMESSCRLQSELGLVFWDWLPLAGWQPFVLAIVTRV